MLYASFHHVDQATYIPIKKNNNLDLTKDEIQHINISSSPSIYPEVNTTDKDQISMIVDYFTSLHFSETELDPADYLGMNYVIRVSLKNGDKRVFIHAGNMFFIEVDKFTYEIPYEEAIQFDIIFANILESNQSKNGEPSITGTVISVESEVSGYNISCTIKDKNGVEQRIVVKDADIIDATGNGWLILHKGDLIKVYYQEADQINGESITVSTVYIKEAGQ
ncbi:MAG: hypothetical protein ACOX6S_00070 [Clostridia bacterium]